jgi:hypothetical protein
MDHKAILVCNTITTLCPWRQLSDLIYSNHVYLSGQTGQTDCSPNCQYTVFKYNSSNISLWTVFRALPSNPVKMRVNITKQMRNNQLFMDKVYIMKMSDSLGTSSLTPVPHMMTSHVFIR